jgi:anti-anti-sigma factor
MSLLMNLVEEPTHWRLSLHGDLELTECFRLRMTANRILATSPYTVVLDLSNLDRLDQDGLGALVKMSHEHTAAGRRLILVTSSGVEKLLCDARLQGIFYTTQTMAGAISMLDDSIQTTSASAFSTV